MLIQGQYLVRALLKTNQKEFLRTSIELYVR